TLAPANFGFLSGNTLTSVASNVATEGADTLFGSSANDTIDGLAGNDTMDGMAGDDSLLGGLGDDNLSGGAGNDILRGQDGDDYFIAGGSAGAGSDTLDGGSNGTFGDTVDYAAATAGVVVDLTTGVASDGGGGSDVLIDIEHVTATRFDDNLRGNSSTNWFRPGAGNDTVDGQAGRDVVMYEDATAGVEIDLRAGVARSASSVDAGVGNDILISIEAAHGSRFDDKVTLSDAGGYVFGRAGNDTLIGGAGSDNLIPGSGNDSIDGGEGYDTVDYFDDGYDGASAPSVGIVADLAAGTVIDNWGFTDRISNIENIRGTGFSDRIVGDGASNNLFGGAGDDTILGFGGNDYIEGGPGNDSLDGGTITDQVLFTDGNTLTYQNSPAAVDVNFQTGIASDGFGGIDQISNFTWVIGSPYNDRLVGFNTIFQDYNGGLGNDTIDGGGGSDRINARSATSSVLIDFALGRMVGGGLGEDTLIDINMASGSKYGDTITGSNRIDKTEIFEGFEGNDTLDGAGGRDMARYQGSPAAVVVDLSAGTAQDGWGGIDVLLNMEDIRGSSYDDLLVGNSQNNEIDGREGADTLRGLAGDDTLIGRAGADYLDGGDGHDSASYRSAPSAIFADLSTGTVQDGTGSTDSLINIEWISGSPFADTMIGSARSEGFAGNDGADTIDGGGGDDEVYYSGSDTVTTGVIVKLSGWAGSLGTLPSGYTGSALDQWGNVDVFRNIIGVEGSNYNDLIIGDSANNRSIRMYQGARHRPNWTRSAIMRSVR
ncbi:MAG: calcium-binding protein, partial [Betaproteobacteria bacterium]|nr:calcium-binding protein [Betaproteobacteria bacterium]